MSTAAEVPRAVKILQDGFCEDVDVAMRRGVPAHEVMMALSAVIYAMLCQMGDEAQVRTSTSIVLNCVADGLAKRRRE